VDTVGPPPPHPVFFIWCPPYARGTPDQAHHPQFPPCPLEEVRCWRGRRYKGKASQTKAKKKINAVQTKATMSSSGSGEAATSSADNSGSTAVPRALARRPSVGSSLAWSFPLWYYGSPPSAVARPAEHQRCGGRGGGSALPTRSDSGGTGTAGPPMSAGSSPRRGAPGPDNPPRGPSGRGRRARQATTDRAPRGGCSALRAERSLPLVCNDRFGGLCMHGGIYLHWLVTTRVKSLSGNWAWATVSALLGRRATTEGGTVVAGK